MRGQAGGGGGGAVEGTHHICWTIAAELLGATPERHDSTGKGTRIEPDSVRPKGGAVLSVASHSHRPLRFVHTAGSPRSRSSAAVPLPRAI